MKPVKNKRYLVLHLLVIALLAIYLLNIYYPWSTGLFLGFFISAAIYFYYLIGARRSGADEDFENTILANLPVALVMIDLEGKVVWHNPKIKEILKIKDDLTGHLHNYLPGLRFIEGASYSQLVTEQIILKKKVYGVSLLEFASKFRLICLQEVIGDASIIQEDKLSSPVLGIIQIDNFSEVMETIEEEKPLILAEIDKAISDWAIGRDGYLKKYTEDKYLVFLTYGSLRQDEENRFTLLDTIRNMEYGRIPLTISMGFGIQEESFSELGRLAHLALELALGRGGDQVVVKSPEQVLFYGGKSKALEKRTKVRARVIAHSLRDMILEADNIFIMGHEGADYDSIGAALGMAAAVKNVGQQPWIVMDKRNSSFTKLLSMIDNNKIPGNIIYPGEGRAHNSSNSLLIVVDTHKPSLVVDQSLLAAVKQVAVIDHHRRGEEFIDHASLTYVEPYASSTSELVTELIQYLGDELELGVLEATALLAGITVDTKNFIFQTGVRTFDAASYLRRIGADPVMVQRLLRDDYQQVVKKAVIIENSQILKGEIALGYYPEPIEEPQVLTAQGADELLNIDGIQASFVICPTYQGGVVISARSTGDINVQLLMEKLGGGGHLTIAAAQLKELSLALAKEELIKLIEENY